MVQPDTSNYAQWEEEVGALEAADGAKPKPHGATLFAGSSTIKLWFSLARDFPALQVVNRGFGGSQIADSTHFAPRLINPLQPRQVLLYAGENDIANGLTPERVLADFQRFVDAVKEGNSGVEVSFISIKPSPGRSELRSAFCAANELIEAWCRDRDGVVYREIAGAMLNSEGVPRSELWVEDGVHLSRAGYKLWAALLGPLLSHE